MGGRSKKKKKQSTRRLAAKSSATSALSTKVSGEASNPSASAPPTTVIEVGNRVKVRGLTSEKGRKLNGLFGKILSFDKETQRWCVAIDGISDGKRIKEYNLRRTELVDEFLHYYLPYDSDSPVEHGCFTIKTFMTLCYNGNIIVYCQSDEEAIKVKNNLHHIATKESAMLNNDGTPRYAVVGPALTGPNSMIPFERSTIVTLINFGIAPPILEYERRIREVFYISSDWPESEPKGIIANAVASRLSPPYKKLNIDHSWDQYGDGYTQPFISVYREDHPESIHDSSTNTFEKPSEFNLLISNGISFKNLDDEGPVGYNIMEWHLLLKHHSGKRLYKYFTKWSWTNLPPEEDKMISISTYDLHNPFSSKMEELNRSLKKDIIEIPDYMSIAQVLRHIKKLNEKNPYNSHN